MKPLRNNVNVVEFNVQAHGIDAVKRDMEDLAGSYKVLMRKRFMSGFAFGSGIALSFALFAVLVYLTGVFIIT